MDRTERQEAISRLRNMPEFMEIFSELEELEVNARHELLSISPDSLRSAQSRVRTLNEVINKFRG